MALIGSRVNPMILGFFVMLGLSCQSPKLETIAEAGTEDQFSKHIRTVDARTPEEQKAGFKLPPGFKIELFASEPDIGKPMNISFDEKGRMWLTQSNEYPFYDSLETGPDKISILEDTNNDGRADKITTFADSLNIPIGVVPVADGAIAYSIPYVYHFIDSDGDDRVDQRKVLLSGFEHKDTHGMINNFYRGLDGFIHADHGFANSSKVVGTDNNEPLEMNSGNTFRFMPDGSKLAFTTTGRVNPYGYAMDEFGYMYSVDCHSSPIYQLVRGADYPHFGKQPSGIGFGPALMRHDYGSTALAGLEYYSGDQYPPEYQQNFYIGDVVKSRVYRSSMKMNGTTPVVTWEPDFVVSDDPWFRPVDVKLGPDGALYIADFYNRIIGHYEVALDHPGRDRSRGRIWRITYEPNLDQHQSRDLGQFDVPELLEILDHSAINIRMQAADQLADQYGQSAAASIKDMINDQQSSSNQFIHGIWILFRLSQLDENIIEAGLSHADERCRVHTLRILFELPNLHEAQINQVRAMLDQPSSHIKRAIVMVLANYPDKKNLISMLQLQTQVPESDTHLTYVIRQGLRDQLRNKRVLNWVNEQEWNESDSRSLANVMVGVSDYGVVQFMTRHLLAYEEPLSVLVPYVNHTAKFLPVSEQNAFVARLRKLTKGDLDSQYKVFRSLERGVTQNGGSIQDDGKMWAIEIAEKVLSQPSLDERWTVIPVSANYRANPWSLTKIEVKDGEIEALISGPQKGPGIAVSDLRSPVFSLSGNLTFTLYGTERPPENDNEPLTPSNWAELYEVGQEQPILKVKITDLEQEMEVLWTLDSLGGTPGYLQLHDGSQRWDEFIGIANLDHMNLSMPVIDPSLLANRQIFASQIAKTYKEKKFSANLEALLKSPHTDLIARHHAAEALLAISTTNHLMVTVVATDIEESELLRVKLLTSLVDTRLASAYKTCGSALKDLTFTNQKSLVLLMARDINGINEIINAAQTLEISPKLLIDPQISSLLQDHSDEVQKAAFRQLTENLKPFSEETEREIEKRVNGYAKVTTSIDIGSGLFQQNCSQCHQIGGSGGNIGPQLDGIGNWGIQALTEKILDPNRNISKAFVTYAIELTDGRSRQGLFRRDEGNIRIFADASGQEFNIPINEISTQQALAFTLMPGNFSEIIPEEEFYHLMSYLINQK